MVPEGYDTESVLRGMDMQSKYSKRYDYILKGG